MIEQNDQELLNGIRANDQRIIERVYKDNYGLIQAYILNNNGSNDDAKDIFQESMIVLYEKAQSAHFQLSCRIKTYLFSVSRRLWLKKLQSSNRFFGEITDKEETADVDEDLEFHTQKDAEFDLMSSAMIKLGEPCKSLIEAFYIEKKNMQEIAAQFGYTNAENAKTQKYKCLMRLKKIFFANHNENEGRK